jgi:hypothetical protein
MLSYGEGYSSTKVLELEREIAGLHGFSALLGAVDQILGWVHEEHAGLSCDASEAPFADERIDALDNCLLVLQDFLVVNLVDKLGTFFDDTESVTLELGPFGDDGVVMAVPHRPAEKLEVEGALATSVPRA